MHLEDQHVPRRILIVDDNPDIHNDFETILCDPESSEELDQMEAEIFGHTATMSGARRQYELAFATQGQEAINIVTTAVAQDQPFQLAFVDMRMPPGWDGLETIEHIWAVDPEVQIVLCTAYSDYSWEQIDQRLQRTENLLILKKPFDVSEVSQMASTLTEKWLLRRMAVAQQEALEDLVRKRTQALQEANRKLKAEIEERQHMAKQLIRAQKMEAIGTLAAGVAHDLNNILSGIVSYPDLLLQQIEPDHPLADKLRLIQKSGRKAAAIVQDMLTLGRRAVTKQDPVNLQTVVHEYTQSPEWHKTQNFHDNVHIETKITPDVSSVIGSEVQIVISLMNLVSNAAEAMPNGGIITISLENRSLSDTLEGFEVIPAGDYVVLGVGDAGEGISQKDIEHIFEPFYTKKKMGRSGTGLGLAVVWGAVRDHKGFLNVSSRPGKGTLFELYFPDSGHKPIAPVTNTHMPPRGEGDFILVVDDVPEQRQIAVEMLVALGYRADAVDSGEAALAYLEKQPVDLLLLDMIMAPGIDGLETYQRILRRHPAQRAIVASGFTKNERVNQALALGAAASLGKPYGLKDLAGCVKKALQK
ncbi:MAG: response regulator [Desulfatitalea sp.]|nr:response regulator [Desulfatitalea sp.]NNK00704.1 response regulator [Desulfatitalea sp.]